MEQALNFNLIIGIAFGILGIVLIVLWITVPFAIFGIKQRLDETNRHLKAIVEQLKTQTEAGATLSLDRTTRHLETVVKQLNAQTETTVHSKTQNRPLKDRSVTRLFRGEIEKDPKK
jgi:uncharacterized protein YoxC